MGIAPHKPDFEKVVGQMHHSRHGNGNRHWKIQGKNRGQDRSQPKPREEGKASRNQRAGADDQDVHAQSRWADPRHVSRVTSQGDLLLAKHQEHRIFWRHVANLRIVKGGKAKAVTCGHVRELHVKLAACDQFAANH